MMKTIRVYTDPDNSVNFTRFGAFGDAVFTALSEAGVFAPAKPTKIQMFTGQGWSLHISGCWGRVVVTGDLETLAEAESFRKEALS